MDKKSSYIIIGVVAVVVIAAAVLYFGRGSKPTAVQPSQPSTTTQAPANAPITPTQQAPAKTPTIAQAPVGTPAIVKAVMSRGIDAKGNATGVATTFSAKTDKIVYAVLTLKNVAKSTKLSYVRYLNGKYVDSKVAQPTKDGITTFYFAFEKGVGDYPKGTYTLKLYINGKSSQNLTYVFK